MLGVLTFSYRGFSAFCLGFMGDAMYRSDSSCTVDLRVVKEEPKGSMYPNSRYLGLKVVAILVLWGQSIYYLGTWTLRGSVRGEGVPSRLAHAFYHHRSYETSWAKFT